MLIVFVYTISYYTYYLKNNCELIFIWKTVNIIWKYDFTIIVLLVSNSLKITMYFAFLRLGAMYNMIKEIR